MTRMVRCPRCKRMVREPRLHTCEKPLSKHASLDERRRSDKLLEHAKDAAAEILASESSSTPLDPKDGAA